MLEFRIRPATLADAPALGRLHRACWLETYAGVLSDRFLAAASAESLADEWAGMLAAGSADATVPGSIVLVAERHDPSSAASRSEPPEPVGFARSAPSDDPEAPRPTKLDSLYTLVSTHGSGLGARLLDGVLDGRPAYAWIVTANERARRFYEKHGFALDGLGHPYSPWDDAHCSRMVR
ncbi:MAG: GNAT family N-acetyltransferase [Microcella sp.]|uniref:GNAT family N-acetyltransferase n=1 Tax=Microcella sp. TaxID=1913979 RepID=UPI0027288F59|nr:GNAT family N-acetyltransferase [Microcella sp.]MDO8337744.1 GNAT family N-acetyltransferase [Microcella sp.]